MPRKIPADMPIDVRRKEIVHTREALRASPDAEDLLPMTDTWLADNEALLAVAQAADDAEARADALRGVADKHLDVAVRAFANDLEHDERAKAPSVRKATESRRFKKFFPVPPSALARMPLADEAQVIVEWLADKDPILDRHRAALTRWRERTVAALDATTASGAPRGEAQIAREKAAEKLTLGRNAVHRALCERAEARGYPTDWADGFFRSDKEVRATKAGPAGPQP